MQTAGGHHRLRAVASGRWEHADITATTTELPGALRVRLASPSTAITRLHLRWRGRMDDVRLLLGFEICRIGDDTSGAEWARTRKMGVNTLAFRGAQHGAFYAADPDCVGVTNAIPWALNRQWLGLVARSGTMLFVSLAPDALGAAQRRDLRTALALAARPQPLGEPLDWQQTICPTRWRLMSEEHTYDWIGADGARVIPGHSWQGNRD